MTLKDKIVKLQEKAKNEIATIDFYIDKLEKELKNAGITVSKHDGDIFRLTANVFTNRLRIVYTVHFDFGRQSVVYTINGDKTLTKYDSDDFDLMIDVLANYYHEIMDVTQ